jgi:hypothetical protein
VLYRSLTTAVLLAVLALAACGNSSSDKSEVTQTVKGFYNALADKDAKKACDAISEKGKERISNATSRTGKKQSCSQVFGLVLAFGGDAIKQAKNVKVSDVKINGDQATASVGLAGRKSPIGLVKENGDWKLSGLDLAR